MKDWTKQSPACPFTVLNILATSAVCVDSYVLEAVPLTQMPAAKVKLRCADLVHVSCCLVFSVGIKPSLYSLCSPVTTTQSRCCLLITAPLLSPNLWALFPIHHSLQFCFIISAQDSLEKFSSKSIWYHTVSVGFHLCILLTHCGVWQGWLLKMSFITSHWSGADARQGAIFFRQSPGLFWWLKYCHNKNSDLCTILMISEICVSFQQHFSKRRNCSMYTHFLT